MAKRKKKPSKKLVAARVIVIVILVLLAAFIVSYLIWDHLNPIEDSGSANVNQVESLSMEDESQAQKGIPFPYQLENGKLEVTSIFQYTGMNPDNNYEDSENMAALAVHNISSEHLAYAQFAAVLQNGTEVLFEVTDVPAGATVWAFAKDNAVLDVENYCDSLTCTAQFETQTQLMADKLSISVNEMEVTLTNNTSQTMTNINVNCHCLFDEAYFGGCVYTYPVESIPAGESVTFQAEDCYLGEAAVVRITEGN